METWKLYIISLEWQQTIFNDYFMQFIIEYLNLVSTLGVQESKI